MEKSSYGSRGGRGFGPGRDRKRERRPMVKRPRPTIFKDVDINYKNVELLHKAITGSGKIMPRRFTGTTAKQQRQLRTAVQRAQFLALLPVGSTKRF